MNIHKTNEHKQIESLNWDHILISISGGKDSAALAQYALQTFPKSKLKLIHAEIDIDWDETMPIVKSQAKHFDLPLVIVQAVDSKGNKKGFVEHLLGKTKDTKTKELKQRKWPDTKSRWCTSILKTGPIEKYARTLQGRILILIGERREESPKRKKLEFCRIVPKATAPSKGRYTMNFSPLLDITEKEIWQCIAAHKIPTHPCYALGVARASCAVCIFSTYKDLQIAKKHAPRVVSLLLDAEKKIDHTYRYKPANKSRGVVKQTLNEILNQ